MLVSVLLVLRALEEPLEVPRVKGVGWVVLPDKPSPPTSVRLVVVMTESLGRFLLLRLYLCDAMQPAGYCAGEIPAQDCDYEYVQPCWEQ